MLLFKEELNDQSDRIRLCSSSLWVCESHRRSLGSVNMNNSSTLHHFFISSSDSEHRLKLDIYSQQLFNMRNARSLWLCGFMSILYTRWRVNIFRLFDENQSRRFSLSWNNIGDITWVNISFFFFVACRYLDLLFFRLNVVIFWIGLGEKGRNIFSSIGSIYENLWETLTGIAFLSTNLPRRELFLRLRITRG